jgi:peroxiredoxin Q/BCP
MNFLDWLGVTKSREPLAMGDAAPEVASCDEQGNEVRLSDFYGEGFTLVYFYPKADTPGCTAQACSLRDDFSELQAHGVRVIGVSADSPDAQRRFKEKHRLPFTLLADPKRDVARAFGVPFILGMPHRQSFLIKDRRVVWRDLHASTKEQARDLLRFFDKNILPDR